MAGCPMLALTLRCSKQRRALTEHITGKPNAGMILHKMKPGPNPSVAPWWGTASTPTWRWRHAGVVGVLVSPGEATCADVARQEERNSASIIVNSVDELLR